MYNVCKPIEEEPSRRSNESLMNGKSEVDHDLPVWRGIECMDTTWEGVCLRATDREEWK